MRRWGGREGATRRWRGARGLGATAIVAMGAAGAACAQGNANTDPPVVLGLTSSATPYYSDDELTLYEAQKPVSLEILKPTAAQLSGLTSGKAPAPYPRTPFVTAGDLTIEIHYTISNIDSQQHTVELLLDPWNEFTRWSPGVTVVSDDETLPNLSGYDNYIVVPAKSRVEGDLSPDDTYNLEANLATVENVLKLQPTNLGISLAAMCNHIFDLQHRWNDGDPLVTPFIPAVIAGMTGFNLGIRTSEPANVAVEVVVDVTDLTGSRVLPQGGSAASGVTLAEPGTVLAPPGAVQGN